MFASIQCVVLDCPDPEELALFYASLLGGVVNQPDPRWSLNETWATLHTGDRQVLAFQRVAKHTPPKWPDPTRPQQFHLDLGVDDLDDAHRRVLELGASLLDAGAPARSWRVFADPAGHPFCLVQH